ADIGIGDHGRATLELAIFLRKLVRGGDEYPGMVFLQQRLRACLMVAVGITVEKQNCDGLNPDLLQPSAVSFDLALGGRQPDLALGQNAFLDLEAKLPLHQRLMLLKEQVVRVRPVDAANLVNVAKAFGDQERGFGPRTLQDGVDGYGRAVKE